MFGLKKKKEPTKQNQQKNEVSIAVTRDNFFYSFLKDNPQSKTVGLVEFGLNTVSSLNFLKEKNAEFYNAINSVLSDEFILFPKVRLLEFIDPNGLSVDLIREIQNITSDLIITDKNFLVKAVLLIDAPKNEFQQKKMLVIQRFCQVNGFDFFLFEDSSDCFTNDKFQSYSS